MENNNWTLSAPGIHGEPVAMRDLSKETVDFCIIGTGAGGGVIGAKLAEAGFSVAFLEAGAHWDPTRDFVSDEMGSRKLFWNDERISGGEDPVELGSNNSGKGVGGSTIHYSMIAMRAHPADFQRKTVDGSVAGADLHDWPLQFEDLEAYYEEVEEALQIAGPTFYPWGKRRKRYPKRQHELNASANMLVKGCSKLGIKTAPAPLATLSSPYKDRPQCVYRGFCNYGCSTNAKSSILVTYIPRAIAAGAEVRSHSMAAQILHNEKGLATGVLYFHKNSKELFLQKAKNVVVAGYAVETPRLLLNSASYLFPNGLGNSSGMVGKCFMVHSGHQVFARFPVRINQYKAPPGLALTEDFNRTIPENDFIAGYTIEVVGPHVGDFASRLSTSKMMWGEELRRTMYDYNYYSGVGIVGEIMPQEKNVVKLHATEKDQYGLPVPHVIFSHHQNDRKLIHHAIMKMTEILEAAGGKEAWSADRTAHLLGTCRMGNDPQRSVVDRNCRSHDISNLFVCDGSVFPTSTAVNPSLTIHAIAARTADKIIESA